MSTYQTVLASVILVGFGVPAWIFALALRQASSQPRAGEPSARYFAYSRVIEFIHTSIKGGVVDCGPIWAAAIRELMAYPEYSDLSLLYLEEVNITGSAKFDRVLEREIKDVEAFLLARSAGGEL